MKSASHAVEFSQTTTISYRRGLAKRVLASCRSVRHSPCPEQVSPLGPTGQITVHKRRPRTQYRTYKYRSMVARRRWNTRPIDAPIEAHLLGLICGPPGADTLQLPYHPSSHYMSCSFGPPQPALCSWMARRFPTQRQPALSPVIKGHPHGHALLHVRFWGLRAVHTMTSLLTT